MEDHAAEVVDSLLCFEEINLSALYFLCKLYVSFCSGVLRQGEKILWVTSQTYESEGEMKWVLSFPYTSRNLISAKVQARPRGENG